MRSAYIVSYDVSDPKRLRRVFKTMYGFGDHIQLSVFRCDLSDADRERMIAKISTIIKHDEDQVLVINIGPTPGRGDGCVFSIGKRYAPRERDPVVV